MTVIELIRELAQVDPDAEISVEEYDGPKIRLTGVRKIDNYNISIDVEIMEESAHD